MNPDDTIMVWIWLKEPDFAGTWQPPAGEYSAETLDHMRNEKISEIYKAAEQPVVASLSKAGKKVTYQSIYAPIIFANLSRNDILELSNRSDVDMIYLSEEGVSMNAT